MLTRSSFKPSEVEPRSSIFSDEIYRQIILAISEGVVLQNAEGTIIDCNPSAERILGRTRDQMIGRQSFDPSWHSIHEDYSAFPGETHPAMVTLKTGEPCHNHRMGILKPDGSLTWISINSYPLFRSGEKKPDAVFTTFTNVTEQILNEAEIVNLKKRLAQIGKNDLPVVAPTKYLVNESRVTPITTEKQKAQPWSMSEILESIDAVFWSTNPETGEIIYLSESVKKITGLANTDFYRNPTLWRSFIHPDDYRPFEIEYAHYQKTGKLDTEFRIYRPDGEICWVNVRAQTLYDSEGKPIRSNGIMTDITRRKKIEEDLRESEERLRLALETANMGIWEWDLSKKMSFSNDQATRFFGKSPMNLTEFIELIYPDDRFLVFDAIQKTVNENKVFSTAFRVNSSTGSIRWMKASGKLESTGGKNSRRLLGVIQDINASKVAEEALRASEKQYRELAEAMPQIVFMTSAGGKINYINFNWQDRFDSQPVSSELSNLKNILIPEERENVIRTWKDSIRNGKPFEIEHRILLKNHGYQWHLTRVIPIRNEVGKIEHWIGTATNIHDRKKAEETLSELLHRIVLLQEEERHRIARELHDQTGQLLAALKVGLKSLEDGSISKAERHARLLKVRGIADSVGHELRNLILELRPVALEELGLPMTLEQHVNDWSSHFGISVDYHFIGDQNLRLGPMLEITLYRIAQEALTNIVKHANATFACVILDYADDTVRLIIEDNGTGTVVEIDETTNDGTRKFGLLGMRERLIQLGGEIHVEPRKGHGTSLFIRIPYSQGNYQARIYEGNKHRKKTSNLSG